MRAVEQTERQAAFVGGFVAGVVVAVLSMIACMCI